MSYPSRDSRFIGERYVNIKYPSSEDDEMWYEKNIERNTNPTQCLICIEAENEMYTKYAHPKAHLDAQIKASSIAESKAIKERDIEDYTDYYIFFYGKEYKHIYKERLEYYKCEYNDIILGRKYEKDEKICDHHIHCIEYHYDCIKHNTR